MFGCSICQGRPRFNRITTINMVVIEKRHDIIIQCNKNSIVLKMFHYLCLIHIFRDSSHPDVIFKGLYVQMTP